MVEQLMKEWKNSKIVMVALGIVLTGLMSWGVWVTRGIFSSTFNQEKIINLCVDIEKVKKDTTALTLKMDVQTVKFDVQVLKAESNQAEIMRNQVEIMKELKARR